MGTIWRFLPEEQFKIHDVCKTRLELKLTLL